MCAFPGDLSSNAKRQTLKLKVESKTLYTNPERITGRTTRVQILKSVETVSNIYLLPRPHGQFY